MGRHLFTLVTILFSANISAEMTATGHLGLAITENGDYHNKGHSRVALGYQIKGWEFQIGHNNLGEFELQQSDNAAAIESRGSYLELLRIFSLPLADVEVGVGVSALKSKALLDKRLVGDTKSNSAFLELGLSKPLSDELDIRGSLSYFDEVAGSPIHAFTIGLRYRF